MREESLAPNEPHIRGVMAVQKLLNRWLPRPADQQRRNAEALVCAYLEASKPEPLGEIEIRVLDESTDDEAFFLWLMEGGCFKFGISTSLTYDGAITEVAEAKKYFEDLGHTVKVVWP